MAPLAMVSGDDHIGAARRHLGDLARLQHRVEASEKAIRAAAQSRLSAVNTDLNRLGPRAITDDAVGEAYQALVTERSQLMGVLATADMDSQP